MKVKSQRDFWSGLMFVVVGGAFAIGALNYNFGSSARPGPAYFPFGLGVLLALLGGMILFEALTIETEDGEPIGAFAWKPLAVILVSVVVFGFALPRLGMVVSLPLLVLMSAYASEEHTWLGSIINAVVLTIMSWAIFVLGLKLTIPMWPSFIGG
ncbi:MAG TPA: tripartite tricarboxylate transporter TctB family protein [Ideonella sp.]|uniref:tripartite tricarboxylate transporter TctB family protein n=1 Tax=Ideonella sp. TaxID=1929293 RepID=UPI002E30F4FA|nr:tripartite tricarboxylate transporter TctB family protein [Ideonella sp.]HEX5684118.1 tripartite tricarboxylate transporter TctB family protein [Ideonella sp.]